ncbi:probable inactive histone-lysine N-methyltransferase SUVR2 isoform X2 [Punica granatum]|uniref:Probable inactive histone-lysine N-methyltransferase SUVR2 isoform X2 n=1 Tax=Punica granatum TaxID=22663 RepID=A0A6P8BRY9_PUNGR|nr:probable inactive histone-lysine N-methyltransferase SUVR2 isoform X2 [Punica granatum]
MAPNPKVKAAFSAMKILGISEDKVKPVLKKLLKVYDKNWELIEEENYRALIDAIFDEDDNKVADQKRKSHSEEEEEEAQTQELQRPLKRLKRRNQENQSIASPDNSNLRIGEAALVQPKEEEEFYPPQAILNERNKGKRPISNDLNEKGNQSRPMVASGRPSREIRIREANVDSGTVHLPKQILPVSNQLTVKPKDEQFTDDRLLDEAPLAVIHPERSQNETSTGKQKLGGTNADAPTSLNVDGDNNGAGLQASETEKHKKCEVADVPMKFAANLEIASSSLGEVKLTISCNSTLGRSEFHMPSLDEVLKMMEDKCLRSYKILDPNFSVMKLMKDMCQCFVELGKDCNDSGDKTIDMGPVQDVLHIPVMEDACNVGNDTANLPVPSVTSDRCNESAQGIEEAISNGSARSTESTQLAQSEGTVPYRLIIPHCQATPGVQPTPLKGDDITNGEEIANISWINEINNRVPPSFRYTPQSLVYEGASVRFSLAHIDNGSCCPSCSVNCLSSTVPCACACANGGEFAYTVRGLVKESFLEECIAMTREPRRRSHFHCQDCPLVRSKGGAPQACNGHLKKKFIKECWRKCGCNRRCGNRVVQRGISCSLQVFMTSEGKGWGLRTLVDLPKGAFVCEYIGEILTINEVQKRNMNTMEGARKTYRIFLDSGWDAASLKDDEALCLDTTCYANVARFINHRCNDANLIEIPVEVESPKHHYYHLAFFTTRKVQALEELTWDYGIDFEGEDQSLNAFQCLCGSKICRDKKSSGASMTT